TARRRRAGLQAIRQPGGLPIVVGGTGRYLRAVLDGLFAGPPRSEELRARLRQRAQEKSFGYLHRLLQRFDLEAAKKIHANDTPKLIRAIEVCLAAREKMTGMWQRGRDPLTGLHVL